MERNYSAKNEALGREIAQSYDQTGIARYENDDLEVEIDKINEGLKVRVTLYGKDYIITCSDYTKNIAGRWQDSNRAAQVMRATIDALRELGY